MEEEDEEDDNDTVGGKTPMIGGANGRITELSKRLEEDAATPADVDKLR